ncbi:DUF1549 domain-containing protein [Isosphaeraceae bacterium EP7]
MIRRLARMTLVGLIGAAWSFASAAEPTAEQARFFEEKVRPILVSQCLKCHGPDKQKSGLRVDGLASMLSGGDSGPAVVPGKPGESLLIAAIGYEDDAYKMPPAKKLAPEEIEALTTWVETGAHWPGGGVAAGSAPPVAGGLRRPGDPITQADREHWAFRPIKADAVPTPADATWASSPIDRFILSKLDTKGLTPNPPASKQEFLRRATYDLTGLPPTPAEVAAFLADDSPEAFERVVDRLLASNHYGEKWGRHWLDLVRYAETNSYERDAAKPSAWRYRDYVIRSFNDDKPYDRFVREQLAGDELADGGPDGQIATGYYRLGIWDDEPTDREQARFDSLDDIVATTGQVFLGMTVDCARCHDHKIDPIPQKDYYGFVAFFNQINHYRNGGPTDEVQLFENQSSRDDYLAKVAALEHEKERIRTAIGDLERIALAKHLGIDPGSVTNAVDLADLKFKFYRDTWDRLPDFDALKPETKGVLGETFFTLAKKSRDIAFGMVIEGALIVPEDGTYTLYLDSDDGSRLLIDGKPVIAHDGVHELGKEQAGSVELKRGRVPIRLEYFQREEKLGLNVAWSGPNLPRRSLSTGRPKVDIAALIKDDSLKLLSSDEKGRHGYLVNELKKLNERPIPKETALCVTEEQGPIKDTFILLRGNPHVPGDKVQPSFLQVLGSPEIPAPTTSAGSKTTGRRTVLADWITSPTNPLTARVMANRLWQHHFNRGIVRSSNNFGTQGDRPTHPELLDWLANSLIQGGWKLKPLHRQMMLSNAYRMSSRGREDGLKADPTNDTFWRFEPRRLSAEEIRDSILAACGNLNTRMFGPGVFPEIPAEVLAGQSVPGLGWGKSSPEEQARRSIYVHVKRSLIMPILESFDVAESDRSSPVRFSTTQPTQALAMLNGSFVNKQAELLADRLRREAGVEPRNQVVLGLELLMSRKPTDAEVERGLTLMGDWKAATHTDDRGALKAFCLVALNLNEFVYLD